MIEGKPEFKIFGKERKSLKKQLTLMKYDARMFWYYHQIDSDMGRLYGRTEKYPMSDNYAQIQYNKLNKRIDDMENTLSIKYDN